MRRWLLGAVALAGLGAGGWFLFHENAPPPPVVAAAPAQPSGVGALGRVEPASRVRKLNQPGGMAVTKWMHAYLGGQTDLTFTDIGPTILKNIPRTVHLYVWHPSGAVKTLPKKD